MQKRLLADNGRQAHGQFEGDQLLLDHGNIQIAAVQCIGCNGAFCHAGRQNRGKVQILSLAALGNDRDLQRLPQKTGGIQVISAADWLLYTSRCV